CLNNVDDRTFSYGYKKSTLVYPQDYIFDIAHLRTNGNLGELIDDMSNIANPEERFEMVKSENRILRERLHNALQREMKAIKTFQKLAHDNRLMHLKLKEYENVNKARLLNSDINEDESPLVNGNDCSPTQTYNGKHRKHARLSLENTQTRTTVDQNFRGTDENSRLRSQDRRELFKTKSSPSLMEGTDDDLIDSLEVRARSASLGSQDSDHIGDNGFPRNKKRSASSGTIDNSVNVVTFPLNRILSGEKRIISFPSNLDVVNEESDFKDSKSTVNRSSLSSEMTQSASSDLESNSPCHTPTLKKNFSENFLAPPNVSLQALHIHSQSLPSALNTKRIRSHSNIEGNNNDLTSKEKQSTSPRCPRRNTADFPRSKFVEHHISTRSLPAESSKSDRKEMSTSPATTRRRRNIKNSPNDVANDIRKFQKMLSTGQISQLSHESDDEEDILQAYEAARSKRHGCRRGSAVVQLPTSSMQMDLHVTTEQPLENSEGRKRQLGSHLALEDKRSSRWSSLLKNKKKLLLQKDRLRMSEDLKEYLSTISRPTRIASETELSLYRETHWTHLMSVTDETGKSRRLSQANNVSLPESEMKRREAVWELFHSEVVYLTAHLLVLKECFLEPLRDIQNKGFLVTVDDKKIFSNVEDLCEVSAKFAKDLLHLFKNEQKDQFGSTASVVTAFTKFKGKVHPQYERYCLSYSKTLHYLETLKQTEHVQDFFKWCESDPRCNRLKLTDLLVAPFQHLTKYPLLLKNIRKRTSEADKEQAPLTTTIKSVEDLIQELEGNVTVIRNYQKLKDLQKNLVWPSVGELDSKSFIPEHLRHVVSHQECGDILASPKRELIYQGPLTLYESAKTDITAFLFDDMLLLTLTKGAKKGNRLRKISASANMPEMHGVPSPLMSRKAPDYTYIVWKQPLPIDRFILYDLDDYPGNSIKNGFVLVHISRFKQAIAIHTLQASSQDVKNIWITKLRDAQTKWNELIEQENEQEKSQNNSPADNRKRNNENIEYHRRMDTDSESAGTNSESNSNEDTSNHIFDEEDMDMQQTIAENTEIADTTDITECDINSNHEHINDIYKQTRPKAPPRKISRLASAI
ncbi:rho guanine nucleotide exchange factor 26-like isoform X1, partial [Paramuricea clavata]